MDNERIKHHDIPKELVEAAKIYAYNRRHKRPTPDDIRKKSNEYERWRKNNGRDPTKNIKTSSSYIPEDLMAACREYVRLKNQNDMIPDDIRELYNEYMRWRRYGKEPPPKRKDFSGPNLPWPDSAYAERRRLKREGIPPGNMPEDIHRGYAEYENQPVNTYTKCGEYTGKILGQGCMGYCGGREGRPRYGNGVAYCATCLRVHTVPDDIISCGCCGKRLRRTTRKRKSR